MSLGVAIGAITFAGSLIAFAKLNGNMSGAPIMLPARHLLNLLLFLVIAGLIVFFAMYQPAWAFWAIAGLSFVFGITLIIPIGGADMPVVVSMLNSYSGWAAAAMGFTLENSALIITRRAGGLVGRHPVLHHVQSHEPQLCRRLRGDTGRSQGPGGNPPRQAGLGRRRRLHHEERRQRHHRAGLWHGGGPGPARGSAKWPTS